jgi:hypothetical protein
MIGCTSSQLGDPQSTAVLITLRWQLQQCTCSGNYRVVWHVLTPVHFSYHYYCTVVRKFHAEIRPQMI